MDLSRAAGLRDGLRDVRQIISFAFRTEGHSKTLYGSKNSIMKDAGKQLFILNQPEVYPPMEGGQVLSFELQVLIKLRFIG